MSWILGLTWRIILFWGLWTAGTLGVAILLDGQEVSADGRGFLGRLTLFGSTAALAFVEWVQLSRGILALEAALRQAGREIPNRWERATHGCLTILLSLGFWAFAILLFSSRLHEVKEGPAVLWIWSIGTVAWTVVSLLVAYVLLGGLSRIRLRVAARGLRLPDLPVTLPWVVGGWCTMTLLLAFFGLPDPRLVAALSTGIQVASAPPDNRSDRELLVELGPDDRIDEIASQLQFAGAVVQRAVPGASALEDPTLASTWVVTVPVEQAAPLALLLELDDENVSAIELNSAVSADPLSSRGPCTGGYSALPVNDPYSGGQPELVEINAHHVLSALPQRPSLQPAIVAVIDTGIAGSHEDLRAVMTPIGVDDDRKGHGTSVASLVGAVADNGRGIASLNLWGSYLKLLSLPALSRDRSAADDVANAIEDALDAGANVINMSFGASGSAPRVVQTAVARALRQGVIVVAAAGNHDPRVGVSAAVAQWPANLPGVLVVGSSAEQGAGRAAFSNLTDGVGLAVSAPGANVCVATQGGGYQRTDGTSMSAATVSGLLGLMKAVCRDLRPEHAARLLIRTGTPQPGSGIGPRIDAAAALGELVERRCGPM